MNGDIELTQFRVVDDHVGLRDFPLVERQIWGEGGDVVSVDVLIAASHTGGCAIGGYRGEMLVGISFGLATNGAGVLHSHYLGVLPGLRGTGLGRQLKAAQRDWALAHQYHAITWTFDPLQISNAHFNINVLGAVGVRYYVDLYGPMGGINGSLPSDRLLVRWDLTAPGYTPTEPFDARWIVLPSVSADAIAANSPDVLTVRLRTREALQPLFDAGWILDGIDAAAGSWRMRPPPT